LTIAVAEKPHNLNAEGKMQKAETRPFRRFRGFCLLHSAFCILPSGCALFQQPV